MAVRIAWHSAGTFDSRDGTGGSNGALMRFEPEKSDPANAGLSIIYDMLHVVKKRHPEVTFADLWSAAGSMAVEFLGGPRVPHAFGRQDFPAGHPTPPNGRLPDASQGASHVREVFGRMGMTDRETVALCGAHTVGRCHIVRSGYDGKWTSNPLKFDNEYFRNLVGLTWSQKQWDGPLQYTDPSGELMMLPTDVAMLDDPAYRPFVELYARDEEAFFADFADAFAKLLSLGCPAPACPHLAASHGSAPADSRHLASAEFREAAMHGHAIDVLRGVAAEGADVHGLERSSGRSALHKAAFWGHKDTITYLTQECKLNPNVQDYNGDTPLHDAARFGHAEVARRLLQGGADPSLRNKEGQTVLGVAEEYSKPEVVATLKRHPGRANSRI